MNEGKTRLDGTDWQILKILQDDARAGFAEIGRAVGLTAPAVKERVARMEREGVISGYRASVNYDAVERSLAVIVTLKKNTSFPSEKHYPSFVEALTKIDGITRVREVTGEAECIAEAAFHSKRELDAALIKLNRFGFHTYTYIVLNDSGELLCSPGEGGGAGIYSPKGR